MYTRVLTFTGATDIDGGVAYLRNEALPTITAQHGYRGVVASADRQNGVLGILSLWDSESDRAASESALGKAREEAVRIVGGTLTVENFEQVIEKVVKPPTAGASLLVVRVQLDPATIDDNVEFFKSVVLPEISAAPGFCTLRNMIDRTTGTGLVGSVWDSNEARDTFLEGQPARQARAEGRGVTFDDTSKREILLSDMKQ